MNYEIVVEGHLHAQWSSWLSNVQITHFSDGTTVLVGELADDAGVYGLLAKLRDMGVTLVALRRLPGEQ
jgi:hypothetical protein